MQLSIIAHNIRSMHNVGAIFRSADCFGIKKVYLTGYTPRPPRKEIHKVALGAEEHVPWDESDDVNQVIDELKSQDYVIAALELSERAVPIEQYSSDKPVALILGSEVEGIDPDLLAKVDVILEIPISGQKSSLNVSVAAGIAMHTLSSNLA